MPSCVSYCPRWYVVQTYWKQERSVAERIENLGFSCYLPEHVPEWRALRGETLDRQPLFPKYLFVQFDIDVDPWRRIHHTTGVSHLLGASPEFPTPIPDEVVDSLLARPEIPSFIRPPDLTGETLRVEGGPWHAFEGVCSWSKDRRVAVLLELFGRKTLVEFRREQVFKV